MEELPIRYLRVTGVRRLGPHLTRVTFGGADLAGFTWTEPCQQVKLYFPKPGQAAPKLPPPDAGFLRWYQAFNAVPEPEQPWTRSYTLRGQSAGANTIDIDFVVHDGDGHSGPATRWARRAQPGDTLAMFGPSAMFARPTPLVASIAEAGWVLLAGEETALPAIGALLESLPEGRRALAYLEVAGPSDEQRFDSRGDVEVHWLHRGEVPAGHSDILLEAVRAAEFPAGQAFAWIAGESSSVRALRRYLIHNRGLDKKAIEFTGHWRLALTQDDAPTAEDLAEAQERLAAAQG
ncbi:siderophore-interacting protein [Amycolatopsis sp. H20-H5]|uniref:siderophore-interacting protein n=1 Tax=Amycolatopsis sp. H20-H5 TaxID=3046309 RepID=UPI002DBA2A1F|nr:siderophore-interacting protein [Amycolatopsis sp. H20-H5]MEC3979708.1 siderophore-interacting protein [Amycolatopsis sp. H20-H5]